MVDGSGSNSSDMSQPCTTSPLLKNDDAARILAAAPMPGGRRKLGHGRATLAVALSSLQQVSYVAATALRAMTLDARDSSNVFPSFCFYPVSLLSTAVHWLCTNVYCFGLAPVSQRKKLQASSLFERQARADSMQRTGQWFNTANKTAYGILSPPPLSRLDGTRT